MISQLQIQLVLLKLFKIYPNSSNPTECVAAYICQHLLREDEDITFFLKNYRTCAYNTLWKKIIVNL